MKRQTETEHDNLHRRVQIARWRVRASAFGGPEWDAASAELEDLERALERHRETARSNGRQKPRSS